MSIPASFMFAAVRAFTPTPCNTIGTSRSAALIHTFAAPTCTARTPIIRSLQSRAGAAQRPQTSLPPPLSSSLCAVADPHASASYALGPFSFEAEELTSSSLGISQEQHDKLTKLSTLVVEWNSRINLVSRKECSNEIVFGRHVLPSAALCAIPDCPIGKLNYLSDDENENDTNEDAEDSLASRTVVELKDMLKSKGLPVSGKKAELIERLMSHASSSSSSSSSASTGSNNDTAAVNKRRKVADIGTGGGFPGLPLAILYPHVDFLLVDSVGKKLKAVQDMVDELELDNVHVHHGRVEELADDPVEGRTHLHAYDVVLGRSVTALPRFCFWISDLLKQDGGKLMYIIGGDVEEVVASQVEMDVPIDDLLGQVGASDKRCLVVPSSAVRGIASQSGEVKRKRGGEKKKKGTTKKKKRNAAAKGEWRKRDNASPKQRGCDSFKRYES